MVTIAKSELDRLAEELTDRLITRGRIPERLRLAATEVMRQELLLALRRVASVTSQNASLLLASHRLL